MKDHTSRVDRNEFKLQELVHAAIQLLGEGAIDVVAISARDISVDDDLANLCLKCDRYGLTVNCPPHVSGPSGFRDLLKNYEYALAILIKVPMESLLSFQRNDIVELLYDTVINIEKLAVKLGYSNSKGFADGCCKDIFCREEIGCRVLLEGKKCRHPVRPSIPGFGINVYELRQAAGWNKKMDIGDPLEGVHGLILIG